MQTKDLLIVPLDKGSLANYEEALSEAGHTVTSVDSRNALQRMARHRFDVAIVEVGSSSDIKLIGDMREVSKGTAVLACVDGEATDLVIQASRIGTDDFMIKSSSAEELRSGIQHAIQRRTSSLEKEEFERRYRHMIENANDAIYTLATNGIFIFANRKTEEVTGCSRGDLIGTSFLDLLTPECREQVEGTFDEYLSSQLPKSFGVQIHNRNGSEVFLDVNTNPIVIDGEVFGVQGIARDVTERKRLERKIAESEERYRSLVESTKDGIVTFDTKGHFTSLNKAAERIFGYRANELLGELLNAFLIPSDSEAAQDHIQKVLRGDSPPLARFAFKIKGHGEKVCEFSSLPLERGDTIIGVVSVVRDLSERSPSGERMFTTSKADQILSSMGDLVMLADETGTLRYLNPAAEEVTGLNSSEEGGTPLSRLFIDSSQLESMLGELALGSPKVVKVVKIKGRDEKVLSLLMTLSLLRDEDKSVQGWIGVSKDITITR